ncbi:hypothetical protein DFJ73DRAFT_964118 [Zopfochytrium polystomum]|nr:hypothetical protein DFJ73DRAFT_964118 [Zopfochytrium polystomum]
MHQRQLSSPLPVINTLPTHNQYPIQHHSIQAPLSPQMQLHQQQQEYYSMPTRSHQHQQLQQQPQPQPQYLAHNMYARTTPNTGGPPLGGGVGGVGGTGVLPVSFPHPSVLHLQQQHQQPQPQQLFVRANGASPSTLLPVAYPSIAAATAAAPGPSAPTPTSLSPSLSSSMSSPPSSLPPSPSAIVVGGGPVGATAALMLRAVGFASVTVYDRVDVRVTVPPFFGDVGGSISIYGNGLRCLRRLGVLDQVLAASSDGAPVMRFMLMDGSDAIARDAVSAKSGELPPVQILRSALHSILMKEVAARGIRVFTAKKLVGFSQHYGDSGVVARFEDGSSAAADILVGADGIQSRTRRVLFPDHPKAAYLASGHLGVFDRFKPVSDDPDPSDDVDYLKPDSNKIPNNNSNPADSIKQPPRVLNFDHPMGLYSNPLAGSLIFAVHCGTDFGAWMVMEFESDPEAAVDKNDDSWRPYSDLPKEASRLADVVRQWNAPQSVVDAVRHANRISPVSMYDLPDLPVLYKGRVVLIGDAAHGTLPTLGQGFSQGLEDVCALGEALTAFSSSPSSFPAPASAPAPANAPPPPTTSPLQINYPAAFSVYSTVRLPRVHKIAAMSRAVATRMQASSPVGMKIGRFVFKGIVKIRNFFGWNDDVIAYDYRPDLKAAIDEFRRRESGVGAGAGAGAEKMAMDAGRMSTSSGKRSVASRG